MPGGARREQAQPVVLVELLQGKMIREAASAAGVDESTVRRWLREDEGFVGELNEARRQLVAAVVADLAVIASEAVVALRGLVSDPETPAAQRLGACREALRHVGYLGEVMDAAEFGERLTRLEREFGLVAVGEEAA